MGNWVSFPVTEMTFVALPLLFCFAQTVSFEMSLAEVPVGWVRVDSSEARLRYQSEHVFRRGKAQTKVSFELDGAGRAANGSIPSARWLLHQPQEACVSVFDEVTGEKGDGCAQASAGRVTKGTLLREPFTARYDASGLLVDLKLGATRFRRIRKTPVLRPERADVFARGFPIEGASGPLTLSPAVKGTRTPRRPLLAAAEQEVSRGACLALAQAQMRKSPGKWQLVLGLVVDEGRAWPHAWLKDVVSGAEVDFSAYSDTANQLVPAEDYLAFPSTDAGRLYVALLAGEHRVVRRRLF